MLGNSSDSWLMTRYEESEKEIPSDEFGQDSGTTESMHTRPIPLVRSVGAEGLKHYEHKKKKKNEVHLGAETPFLIMHPAHLAL